MKKISSWMWGVYALLTVQMVLWVGLAVLLMVNAHPGVHASAGVRWGMAALFLAVALVLGGLMWAVRRGLRWALPAAWIILGGLAFSLFLDQFGWADFAMLLLFLAPAVILTLHRKRPARLAA
ncbi:hypothetical protein [Levilinea saccharolytica]|uniref:Uncharacterized protein n=1 Tax=Levilinea saccharolytica TaxID=229921 RepID=A0A0P6YRH5_9CHLR|nr:hypothetical protein [Levilinea saccharolytica]KPL85808.1 hypothetical protein ADN01_05690 [Levilinea saccharolytica]GAP16735.1 hypothetical protein LSAC_00591 [Levilinea saccharolytica]